MKFGVSSTYVSQFYIIRGVIILTETRFSERNNNVPTESIELVGVKIQALRFKNINSMAVYRPPHRKNFTPFSSETDDLLKSISILETAVFDGDININ